MITELLYVLPQIQCEDQTADLFTKALSTSEVEVLLNKLGGHQHPLQLEGECRRQSSKIGKMYILL